MYCAELEFWGVQLRDGERRSVRRVMSSSCSQSSPRRSRVPPRGTPLAIVHSMLGANRPKSREAEHLALGVVGLYQPVAVEKGAVAPLQGGLLLLVAHACHES